MTDASSVYARIKAHADSLPPTPFECVASGVLLDGVHAFDATDAICPACGVRVMLGGTPTAPRYSTHNEGSGMKPGCCKVEGGVLTHAADDPDHGVTALLDADLERMVGAVVDPAMSHEQRQRAIRDLSAERRAVLEGQRS